MNVRMKNVAIITLPLTGHLNPMGVVAEGLARKGHLVTVIGPQGVCELAHKAMPGVELHAIGDADYPQGRLDGFLGALPDVKGLRGIGRVIGEIADLSALYIRQLEAALVAVNADVVVYDQLEPAAGLIAKAMGLPHVSLACALPMNRSPDLPPPYLGWPYRDSAWWRSLYGGGYLVVDRMMAPQGRVLARAARDRGLPEGTSPSDFVSDVCDLSQCVPGFDYSGAARPVALGPLRRMRRAQPRAKLDFERDGRDLVFCTLGTIMGHRIDIFEAVARACDAAVVQCVITHGGKLDAQQEAKLRALPGQPVVRAFVDQQAVLGEARAAVLHGGLNSVQDALHHGVPMMVLPMAFEQAAIAARVRRAGAGVVVKAPRSGHRLKAMGVAKRLSAGLDAALNDEGLREAAGAMARASRRAGGAEAAVARIEAVMEDGAPGHTAKLSRPLSLLQAPVAAPRASLGWAGRGGLRRS